MTVVVEVVGLAAIVLAGIVLFRWIAIRRAAAARSLPPLLYPMSPADPRESLGAARPRRPNGRVARPAASTPPRPSNGQDPVASRTFNEQNPLASRPSNGRNSNTSRQVVDDKSAETVRFVRPVDEPVQLLPGRLEVLAGEPQHREIRFVRLPGQPLQLFLGRDGGPSPQYVGLSSSTVSRQHARFAYTDGRWFVTNLSQTNPLIVNDDELAATADQRLLVDGDRLELGEVVLRFHAH